MSICIFKRVRWPSCNWANAVKNLKASEMKYFFLNIQDSLFWQAKSKSDVHFVSRDRKTLIIRKKKSVNLGWAIVPIPSSVGRSEAPKALRESHCSLHRRQTFLHSWSGPITLVVCLRHGATFLSSCFLSLVW